MERINREQSQDDLYKEFIDLCKLADESGFCTIWTGEHHGMNFTIAPNPFLNLVDLSHHMPAGGSDPALQLRLLIKGAPKTVDCVAKRAPAGYPNQHHLFSQQSE